MLSVSSSSLGSGPQCHLSRKPGPVCCVSTEEKTHWPQPLLHSYQMGWQKLQLVLPWAASELTSISTSLSHKAVRNRCFFQKLVRRQGQQNTFMIAQAGLGDSRGPFQPHPFCNSALKLHKFGRFITLPCFICMRRNKSDLFLMKTVSINICLWT